MPPDSPEHGEASDLEDLYMLLNLDRTAQYKEVRTAYLRLALCLHPDKATASHAIAQQDNQNGPVLDAATRQAILRGVRQRADEQFVRVERAYRVLSDPIKRLIYDEYGHEGLVVFEGCEMAKKSVGAHLKHPAEIRRLLNRILQEAAQKRLTVPTETSGRMSVECTCVPFRAVDGKIITKNLFPDVTRLHVRQSVKVPLTDASRVTCGGYSVLHRGIGTGTAFATIQHDLSPYRYVGSALHVGPRPTIGVQWGGHSKKSGRSLHVNCAFKPERGMGYKVTTSERLDPSTTLVTSWGMGGGGGAQAGGGDEDPAAMHVVKVVNEGAGIVMGQFVFTGAGWDDLGLRLSYRHHQSPSRAFQVSGKIGGVGMEMQVDSRRYISRQSKMKVALRLNQRGVSAVFSLQRGEIVFELPILLSTILSGWSLTVGGLIPAVVEAGVGWLMSAAWKRRADRIWAEEEPDRRRRLVRSWKDAASQTRLMLEVSERTRAEEQDKGGLVIVSARYGLNLSKDCGRRWWSRVEEDSTTIAETLAGEDMDGQSGATIREVLSAPNVDVTVPLQFFVKDSSLTLPPASKASLLGFYSPAPCRLSGDRSGDRCGDPPRDNWGSSASDYEGFTRRNEGWHRTSHPTAQLYIVYEFAGRMFEETFTDTKEVVLPSPTSTYRGSLEVR